jgi:hypothetical protein
MQITVHSTSKLVVVDGQTCRLWEGTTANGQPVYCLIRRVFTDQDADQAEFEKDLQAHEPPSEAMRSFPAHLIH